MRLNVALLSSKLFNVNFIMFVHIITGVRFKIAHSALVSVWNPLVNDLEVSPGGIGIGLGVFWVFRPEPKTPGFGLGFGSKILDSGFWVGFWVPSWVWEPNQTQNIFQRE